MAIFTLSIFGIIFGVAGFAKEGVSKLILPKGVRGACVAFLSVLICVFLPMWSISMIPHIHSNTVPDFYAVFILDLCIFLPFFMAVIYMLIKDFKSVYVLLGIALIKTMTLVLSVAIGEMSVTVHGQDIDITMVGVYCGAFTVSLLLLMQYCSKLKILK
jgi:hypothetical protein